MSGTGLSAILHNINSAPTFFHLHEKQTQVKGAVNARGNRRRRYAITQTVRAAGHQSVAIFDRILSLRALHNVLSMCPTIRWNEQELQTLLGLHHVNLGSTASETLLAG